MGFGFIKKQEEIDMEQDSVSRLLTSAREAEGKKASKSDMKD